MLNVYPRLSPVKINKKITLTLFAILKENGLNKMDNKGNKLQVRSFFFTEADIDFESDREVSHQSQHAICPTFSSFCVKQKHSQQQMFQCVSFVMNLCKTCLLWGLM